MGRAKEHMLECQERGFEDIGKYVCTACVEEPNIQLILEHYAEDAPCSYCAAVRAASMEELLRWLVNCLSTEWTPYDSHDHGEAHDAHGFEEIILYEEPCGIENEDIIKDLIGALDSVFWVRGRDHGYTDEDPAENVWDEFKTFVTHRFRFTSLLPEAAGLFEEEALYGSADYALKYVLEAIEKLDMVRILPQGSPIIRARATQKRYNLNNPEHMGTVPRSLAKQANRMSPVGIPMFYGAFDKQTAIKELPEYEKESDFLHLAIFKPSRDIHLVDFTHIPVAPSIYSGERELRGTVVFLRRFADEISKPIEKDRPDHLEYLPSQIVTEYLKLMGRHKDKKMDGIIYKSAHDGTECIVIFVENSQCVEEVPEDGLKDLYLLLESYEITLPVELPPPPPPRWPYQP